MTRRDFILLSGALRKAYDNCKSDVAKAGVRAGAFEISEALSEHNSAFDVDRFMKDATGVVSAL